MKRIFGLFLGVTLFAGSVAPALAQDRERSNRRRDRETSLYYGYQGRVDDYQRSGSQRRYRRNQSLYFGYWGNVGNSYYQRRGYSNYGYQRRNYAYPQYRYRNSNPYPRRWYR